MNDGRFSAFGPRRSMTFYSLNATLSAMKRIVWAAFFVVLLPFVAQESATQELQNSASQAQKQSALITEIAQKEKLSKRIIAAFEAVPRERFLPQYLASMAYVDSSLPLGNGQTLPSPSDLLRAVQALGIQPTESVLLVGSSNTYLAALLSRLAARVYDVELIPNDRSAARRMFAALGYTNITIAAGGGLNTFSSSGPFNGIFVHGATPDIPAALVQQLSPAGRMVVPLRDPTGFQMVVMVSRNGGDLSMRALGKGFYSPVDLGVGS